MSLSVGNFYCKTCNITFEGEYKPQKRPRKACPKCHKIVDLARTNQIKKKTKNTPEKEAISPLTFIDEPDELLMDLAMTVLNRQRHDLLKDGTIPSNQWANVLITTRKENIGKSKKEGNIQSKFKSMDIKDIAKILSTKQKDTSPKPDLKESS